MVIKDLGHIWTPCTPQRLKSSSATASCPWAIAVLSGRSPRARKMQSLTCRRPSWSIDICKKKMPAPAVEAWTLTSALWARTAARLSPLTGSAMWIASNARDRKIGSVDLPHTRKRSFGPPFRRPQSHTHGPVDHSRLGSSFLSLPSQWPAPSLALLTEPNALYIQSKGAFTCVHISMRDSSAWSSLTSPERFLRRRKRIELLS